VDLRFSGFVANLKLGCMDEKIRTELGKKSRSSKKFAQKGALTLKGTLDKYDLMWYGVFGLIMQLFFNYFRQI